MRALAAVLIAGFLTQYYFVILACMLCGVYFFARLRGARFETAGRFALWCFCAGAGGGQAVPVVPESHFRGLSRPGAPSKAQQHFG